MKFRTLAGLVLLALAALSQAADGTLRVGIVGEDPQKALNAMLPLNRLLAERLAGAGIHASQTVVAADLEAMQAKVHNGDVDMVMYSSYGIIRLGEHAGCTLSSLLFWRKGTRTYQTLFFVLQRSPIQQLADLRGRTIAFESPMSTSGFIVPKALLIQQGLHVVPRAQADAGSVGYIFASEEINQAFQVSEGRADAGAFNDNDWDELPDKLRAQMRVIHRSRPMLRWLACFAPQVSPELRQAVEAALLGMNNDASGLAALNAASRIKRVERLRPADQSMLDELKALLRVAGP